MIQIYPVQGPPINVLETSITLVAGPYPSDVGPYTYIHGFGPGVVVTLEPVQHFLLRLNVVPALVQFTRPDRSPVWIKAGAATNVTPPLPPGAYDPAARTVIWLGQLRQAVTEMPDVVVARLRAGVAPGAIATQEVASLLQENEAAKPAAGARGKAKKG